MNQQNIKTEVAKILVKWYKKHHRNLPWRQKPQPYNVWLSEIILQQTRIDQGLPYYQKIIRQYPTVTDLANAGEGEILKMWQGLGYYSRARNLHKAARLVCEDNGGEFPSSYQALKQLPGIGEYTAAAVASIAAGEPVAVVDGNVYRVLSRVFNIDKPIDQTRGRKHFKQLANSLIKGQPPGIYNQAIMEFGARVCVPINPDCESCPLNKLCLARAEKVVSNRPVKLKKLKKKDRFFYYFFVEVGDKIWMKKRIENDIWRELYDFPLLEMKRKPPGDFNPLARALEKGILPAGEYEIQMPEKVLKWPLTHQNIHLNFIRLKYRGHCHKKYLYFAVDKLGLNGLPVPIVIHKYLSQTGWI